MPEQKTKPPIPDPVEIAAGAAAEEPTDGAAAVSGEATAGQTELEQLKAERDQLLDRLARLQAEF